MKPDRSKILTLIIDQLHLDLASLEQAVAIARDTATHADCLGASKYETMGLEASYLAQGQGTRLLEIEHSLEYFKRLLPVESSSTVALSSLVTLEDDQGDQQLLWLALEAGGLKVICDDLTVTVITPRSPLGGELTGRCVGDAFEVSIAGNRRSYEVVAID